jgi:peptide-methionine (S)-S-oxide reductase
VLIIPNKSNLAHRIFNGAVIDIFPSMQKIGFGGSCHWCTEAIFQSLKGVMDVQQGWISSDGDMAEFSEAVIVEFEPAIISLKTLIAIHLHTHSSTSAHSMRTKYRSAIYTFDDEQVIPAQKAMETLQQEFNQPVITSILPFRDFKLNKEEYLDYYYRDPEKPFCRNMIDPKLKLLIARFSKNINVEKINGINFE